MKICLVFALWIVTLIISAKPTYAEITYPISELDGCRNERECQLYCDIPANTPACWSYGKYVMNPNILGEETVNITYPIADLGNCSSAGECFLYCANPQNQLACTQFAKIGEDQPPPQEIIEAAKTELGCEGKEACMAICNQPQNMEKCASFAQKYGLGKPLKDHKPPPPQVLKKAKSELGCDSEISCMNICNKPENMERCMQFAKKYNLMKAEEIKKYEMSQEEYLEKKTQMMEKAKEELGCDTFEACSNFCEKRENMEKCANLGRKHGLIPPNPALPCTTQAECRTYCQKHPEECPGSPF